MGAEGLALVVFGTLALMVWFIIPAYLRLRYHLPYGSGIVMEMLIVAYWMARVLRLPVDGERSGGDGEC